jgi:hypothetical protein
MVMSRGGMSDHARLVLDTHACHQVILSPCTYTVIFTLLCLDCIRFESSFHRAFNGAIDVFRPWKEPFLLIITLIAVLVDGERPILHLPRVLQTTNGRETSIILPIQIEKLAPVTRDIQTVGVAYDGGIEALDDGGNLRLDLVGYPSCGGTFRTGFALARTVLGLGALGLLRALYRDHLAPIKHNGMLLRGRVREIDLLLLVVFSKKSD